MIKIVEENQNKKKFYLNGKYEEMIEISGLDYFVNDQETSNKLKLFSFADFPPIGNINFENYFEWCEIKNYVFLAFDENLVNEDNNSLDELNFGIRPNLLEWTFHFSFSEYREIFIEIWEEINTLGGEVWRFDTDEPAISIVFPPANTNTTINEYVLPYEKVFKECHIRTLKVINEEISKQQIISYFDFPEEMQISCEQYLIYFAKFLQDLGINATSNLKEEAGKVLFSVTPTDDIEALDKIREALAVYLNLPSSPIVYDDSFAAMRLKQQIDSLKHSQQMAETEFRLRMAQSLVEAQNKTIEDQSGMIVQQATFIQQQEEHIEKITNPAVMIKSAENKEEFEELYEGVKVGESETLKKWLGISLNPAKVIKTAVKNTLGKDDGNKSILGLDEETK